MAAKVDIMDAMMGGQECVVVLADRVLRCHVTSWHIELAVDEVQRLDVVYRVLSETGATVDEARALASIVTRGGPRGIALDEFGERSRDDD